MGSEGQFSNSRNFAVVCGLAPGKNSAKIPEKTQMLSKSANRTGVHPGWFIALKGARQEGT
jgi:hypothetical protein